jgi:STAS domain
MTFTPWPSTDSHEAPGSSRTELWLQTQQLDHGSLWVLQLTGEADLATRSMFEEELAEAVAMHRERVVLDVTRLRFCDVGSAELVLTTARTTPISLAGAAGPVKRVFEMLDPLERAPRYRSIWDARIRR